MKAQKIDCGVVLLMSDEECRMLEHLSTSCEGQEYEACSIWQSKYNLIIDRLREALCPIVDEQLGGPLVKRYKWNS